MKQILCDRLLVNDTCVSDTDIRKNLWKYCDSFNISVVNGLELGEELLQTSQQFIDRADRLIFPWSWSYIFWKCTSIEVPNEKKLILPSIKRKLSGLSPRGINISEEDLEVIQNIKPNENIWVIDDVIASWTTINGIIKRLGRSDIGVFTLISRKPNELRKTIKDRVISACEVSPVSLRIPAINTLSSLSNPEKSELLFDNFERVYGDDFTERFRELFPNI
jgi:hypothetical protein